MKNRYLMILAFAAFGCELGNDDQPTTAAVTTTCDADADCEDGQVCQNEECRPACELDADCDEGDYCVEGHCVACRIGTDDDGDEVIDGCDDETETCVEGACRPRCEEDRDCDDGEVCRDETCMDSGDECDSDSDCAGDERCLDGNCVEVNCRTDEDCDDDDVCTEDVCGSSYEGSSYECAHFETVDLCSGGECESELDCSDGEDCTEDRCTIDGECVFIETSNCADCNEDSDCSGGDECVGGSCVDCDTDLDCSDNEQCQSGDCVSVASGCNEASDCEDDDMCTNDNCVEDVCEYFTNGLCTPQEDSCDDPTTIVGPLGFESSLSNFEAEEYSSNADATLSRDSSEAYEGDASLRLTCEVDDPDEDTFWQCMAKLVTDEVEPGEVYRVSFRARANASRTDVLQVMSDSNFDVDCGTYNPVYLDTDWTRFEYVLRRPACGGDGRVSVNGGLADGVTYVDEFQIEHCN